MDLLPGHKYAYEGVIGCKTGYTNDARSTLISCAERNGMKLICVVLQDEAPFHYEDTLALYDYGFGNFDKINISQTETKYNIDTTGSFYSDNDIFGSSKPLLALNPNSCIVLPKDAHFSDADSEISYETDNERQAAVISYTYLGVPVGSASVDLNVEGAPAYDFDDEESVADGVDGTSKDSADKTSEDANASKENSYIFINVFKVLLGIVGVVVAGFLIFLLIRFLSSPRFVAKRNNRRSWLRERAKRRNRYQEAGSLRAKRKAQARRAQKRRRRRRPNRFRDYDF